MEINLAENLVAGAHEILSPATSTGFTAATMVNDANLKCKAALVSVGVQNCRYRMEGTPDADTGHQVNGGDYIPFLITGPNLDTFRIIELVSGAKVQVTYLW